MKVKVSELKAKMTSVLKAKGYSDEDIPFVINMYLGGELRGHTSHGLSSFAAFAQINPTEQPEPVILRDTHAMLVLDAKGANGNILGKHIADEALKRAKAEGVGTVLVHDLDSWLRPGAIAEYIAQQGYVATVINSGGGTSVAPPGGFDPVIGTNPIAYGIPTNDEPLVVDMATAMHAWGQVRLANKYGTHLPPDAFYDDHGTITRDGKEAYSVKAAGDYKGFALGLLVEVLCGSLVDIPMMLTSTAGSTFNGKIPNRGAVVTVYDPGVMIDPAEFKQRNSKLLADIQNSQALPGETIRIPGVHAGELQAARTKDDSLDIPDELWEEIRGL
ncbi:MAG TPA: Ldh family oxidoreductase [Candidatus Saccharimonadales bacterium]|nr:Ldh family oxidoreductase [Candidatus Saccharimonadales bacterium]